MADNPLILSDKALEQLDALAKRFNASPVQVVEFLIADRHSVSDEQRNIERAQKAWKDFCSTHILGRTDPDEIFGAGYETGWLQFQTRHGDNKFVIVWPKPQ